MQPNSNKSTEGFFGGILSWFLCICRRYASIAGRHVSPAARSHEARAVLSLAVCDPGNGPSLAPSCPELSGTQVTTASMLVFRYLTCEGVSASVIVYVLQNVTKMLRNARHP